MSIDKNNGATRGNGLCNAILRCVERLTAGRLVALAIAVGLTLTVLGVMGLALEVGSDQGMERFLEAGADQRFIARKWAEHGVWWLAVAFLAIDAVLFVPMYGALLIALAPRAGTLNPHWSGPVLIRAIVFLALAAMLADEAENLFGLGGLLLSGAGVPAWVPVLATKLKWFCLMIAAGLLLLAFLSWFFALGNNSRRQEDAIEVLQRARLRFAVVDIVWRSRYVLASLAFFAGLVLVMNQSRDVLAGVAHGWQSRQYGGAAFAMLTSAISVWALAYMCWMWTRILCRLRRPASIREKAKTGAQHGATGDAIPPQVNMEQSAAVDGWPLEAHQFAKWWARLLGAAPVLMVVWLCGLAARDAVRAEALSSACILLGFGAMTLLGAIIFMWGRGVDAANRSIQADEYYEYRGDASGARGELHASRYHFLWMPVAPLSLPVAALLFFLTLRLFNLLLSDQPPVTLGVICCAMTLWTGVVGLLAQFSLRRGLPVLGGLLALVALLGWWGATDNHMVWNESLSAISPPDTFSMWTAQALVAFALLAAVVLICSIHAGWRLYVAGAAALLIVAAPTAWDFARKSPPGNQSQVRKDAEAPRPELEKALVAWLERLCGDDDKHSQRCQGEGPLTVYFVSAEGGGIRAAYWPALVLAELSARIPDFDRRTFSMSGVSGGAVGVSVYRVCRARHPGSGDMDALRSCIRRLGARDLLTPLLGSWMFEDVLARFIPTRWCNQPGCGFLSRGAWFERGLEEGLAQAGVDLRMPLASLAGSSAAHLPHLFLNSTWVETGERAIASDVRVCAKDFPTARDQIDYLGVGLPLSTAAHNAARFPFVNAIGSVRIAAASCPSLREQGGEVICGHLADGGYFDNSGGHTTGDILRVLQGVLQMHTIGVLDGTQPEWLRAHLVAQVIMVRNGVDAPAARDGDRADEPCDARDNSRPRCAGQWKLFADFLGPIVTASQVLGTGANGRLAESLQAKAVSALRPSTAGSHGRRELLGSDSVEPVVNINLENGKVMYPLGWYLSLRARCGMENVAADDGHYAEICRSTACRADDRVRPRPDRQCGDALATGN